MRKLSGNKMKKALTKDIFRTIKKEKKRFFSILLITALGVTMLTGLRASCNDLRYSADALYDEQNLFDIQISSTLGLDEDDIAALSALEEVLAVEGEYAKTVYTDVDGVHEEAKVRTLCDELNVPTVLEGELPDAVGEIAVTESYLLDTGKQIGDTLTFSEEDLAEDEEAIFPDIEYTIVAEVLDPFDVNNREGTVAFRAAASAAYTFFVVPQTANSDIYTAVYVSVAGAEELMCYTQEYTALIQSVKTTINTTLKEQQQQNRYNTVYQEAMAEYNDALEEVLAELADAQQEIDDGWEEVQDGWAQLTEGKEELTEQEAEAKKQIAEGLAEIADGYAQIEEAKQQLADSSEQIEEGEAELAASKEQLEQTKEETFAQIADGMAQLTAGKEQVQAGIDALSAQLAQAEEAESEELQLQLASLQEQLALIEAQLLALEEQQSAAQEQFASAEAALAAAEEELADGKSQYEAGLAQIAASEAELKAGEETLEEQAALAEEQIAEAWAEIEENEQKLLDAEEELSDGQAELDEATEEAMEELAEALEEINEIEMTRWYIQSRTSLSGYSNVDSDSTSIEGIGTFLPVIFLVVAILISLTAITRMVEEDRGLIGTYKALGFKNREIRRKYMVYAAGASFAGGIVGNVCGFLILPKIIFTFFAVMYTIPVYVIRMQWMWGLAGILIFMVGILLAVAYAVRCELVQMPAVLMRPLVPKSGTRIFLERIGVIWKRISFLNKVTARNLFRYKKRFVMTVIGILGCTGLLVCGFAIKDTVADLMGLQYENVNRYDILAVASSSDNDALLSYMEDDENIESYLNLQVESVTIRNEAEEEQYVQILVVPDGADLSTFLKIADTDGTEMTLTDAGIYVTHSIGLVLDLTEGDVVTMQDLSLNEAEVEVALVTENYLGDMIYMTQSCYEACFALDYAPNAVLVKLTESCKEDDPVAYAKELGKKDGLLSTVSTQQLKDEFSQAFTLMNLVVYVILVLAAALAFVVLFTLSTTNISERCRELATIKVLGFYDKEVHLYVNKETLILSVIGILLGLPAGKAFASCMTWALKIPGVYFAVRVHTTTYVICGVTALVFAIIVNQITNKLLNAIDPVEALKSVE